MWRCGNMSTNRKHQQGGRSGYPLVVCVGYNPRFSDNCRFRKSKGLSHQTSVIGILLFPISTDVPKVLAEAQLNLAQASPFHRRRATKLAPLGPSMGAFRRLESTWRKGASQGIPIHEQGNTTPRKSFKACRSHGRRCFPTYC